MAMTLTKTIGWSAAAFLLAGAALTHGSILNGLTADNGVLQFNPAAGGGPVDTITDGDGFLGNVNDTSIRVGQTNSTFTQAGNCAVFVFELPSLGANEQFASASLTFTISGLASSSNKSFTVDLYGLGARSASTVSNDDYYEGADDSTDASRLQQAIISPTGTNGANGSTTFPITVTTSATGNANLLSYMNTQYDSGAGAGKFVFLRLNTQEASAASASGGYTLVSANGTAGQRPFVTYTTELLPEPATMALLGLGGLLMAPRRRRA